MKRKRWNGLESAPKKRRRLRATPILTIAAIATAASCVANAVAWGQISTATKERGAGSLLDSTQSNERFSGERYDGALQPTAKSDASRFSSGAVRGSAGNVVGVDASRNGGRFTGASEFRSKQNFELFYWRNELLRAKSALERDGRAASGAKKGNAPRLTTAKEPKPMSHSDFRRGVRYGRTPEEVAAARQAELAAAQTNGLPNAGAELGVGVANGGYEAAGPLGGGYDPATIWMRGRAPIQDFSLLPFGALPETNGGGWVELDGRPRSEFAGASLAPSGASIAPLSELAAPVLRSPEEKRRAYQEYLTTRLLQTPAVNPLSPVSVEFRDGVATISGIVPTPSAREAAGRVLLAEPDVRRVENRLTFVRPDGDAGLGAAVPVAPAPGSATLAPSAPLAETPRTPSVPALPQTPNAPNVPSLPQTPNAPNANDASLAPAGTAPGSAPVAPSPVIPILPDVGSAPLVPRI